MKRFLLRAAVLAAGVSLLGGGCNLGPFPDFLQRLDPLDPVRGEVKGWILANENESHVLVLSQSGRFLHSVVGRDTSVELDVGRFEIDGGEIVMVPEIRYEFPQESGPIGDREGAHSQEIAPEDQAEERRPAELEGERLFIEGWGTFASTSDYVHGLDLESRQGRGCLLKYIQLSIRTIQSRIQNFGSQGTVIYHNNESSFVGFLSGEQSIIVENLLSPDTTITYDDFQDFPEIRLDGSFVSHVNTSGDGTLDDSVDYTIFETSESGEGAGGAVGFGGAKSTGGVLARGRLMYGPADPIQIEQADVVGGSYDFEITYPLSATESFGWQFLADLDLRECSVLAE